MSVRSLLGRLPWLGAWLLLLWLVWAVSFHTLEPDYGWLRAFDWATYTVTTNGEGSWVPTRDATVLLAIVARIVTWLSAFLFAALIVKHAIPDPTVFSHTEQRVLLGRAILDTADERDCSEADAVAYLLTVADRNAELLADPP